MTRHASRLHTLERGLKAPRKSRVKARALTVMRLDDGATGAQASVRPARLPKDIEDQIAVVRGRAVGKPSRGLLQLEARLLRTQEIKPAPSVIQRHNHVASSLVTTTAPGSSAPLAQARAMVAPIASGAFGGHFNVESFEDASVGSPRTELSAGTAPVTTQWPVTATPAAGEVSWAAPRTDIPAGTVPWATEQSRRAARKRALTPDQKAAAESFERDVAAMLGAPPTAAPEDKQWEDTMRTVAGAAPPAAPVPAAAPAQKTDAHEVFNQMGLAMNYANRFDLGAVDLSARFDQFDNELAVSPAATPAVSKPVPVQSLALDDFDLVADLAELSGSHSIPPLLEAKAAGPSMTTPEQAMTPAT